MPPVVVSIEQSDIVILEYVIGSENIHPVLLPWLTELLAYHTAPPVAILSFIKFQLTLTIPKDFDKMNVFPAEELAIVHPEVALPGELPL